MFCSKCGKQVQEGSKFCLYCGEALAEDINNEQPLSFQASILPEEMRLYIGKNSDYYMQKFNVLSSSGGKASWNWAAFLLTIPWCIYRKMYREGVILAAISLFCGMIPVINMISTITICVVCGVLGNSFYLNHIYKLDEQASAVGLSNELRSYYALTRGGTSIESGVLFSMFTLAINLLLSIYLTSMIGGLLGGILGGML